MVRLDRRTGVDCDAGKSAGRNTKPGLIGPGLVVAYNSP
jgi:hypothetical protein